jgi:hypothetical protein
MDLPFLTVVVKHRNEIKNKIDLLYLFTYWYLEWKNVYLMVGNEVRSTILIFEFNFLIF